MDYGSVLNSVVRWADGLANVRAVVLTGSAAAATAHPLSDRDIELHVRETAPLEQDDSWWDSLGKVLAVERLENGDREPTRLVHYVGGKLDFTLVRVDKQNRVYERPFSVLLDKDGATARFQTADKAPPLPDQDVFDESANWCYAAALMIARAIARDEPWSVKTRDNDLKAELLRMIEWDHRARRGVEHDVRYCGVGMRAWMDPDVQQKLADCWASFDLAESQKALRASLDLFRELAERVTACTGLTDFDHDAARDEVDRILAAPPTGEQQRQPETTFKRLPVCR